MKLTRLLITHSPFLLTILVGCGLLLPELVFAQQANVGSYVDTQSPPDVFGDDQPIAKMFYYLVIGLFGSMMGIAGWLLDFAINEYVINFGDSYLRGGVGEAVDLLWVTVRDFFNVMFIFGLVYIGFKMILNSDDSSTRKNLIYLIMAALLINFSLFITKFVVDFTNILATEIAIAGFPEINEEDGKVVAGRADIANRFFDYMDVQKTLQPDSAIQTSDEVPWLFIFGNAMIYIVGAFVFGAGAFLLIIRFAVLSVYMVLSPFMFVGWVFPGFSGTTRKYWSGFLGRAFYAPVYMLMIYFAGAILSRMFADGGSAQDFTLTGHNGSAVSFAAILGPFILSCVFLIAAIQVAGKLSADGAGTVMKVGSNLSRRVQRGAIRNTVGYGAYRVSKASDKVSNSRTYRQLNANLGSSTIGRNVAAGLDNTLAAGSRASVAGSRTAAQQSELVQNRRKAVNSLQDENNRAADLKANLGLTTDESKIKVAAAIGRMTDNEILNLSEDELNTPEISANLTEAHIKLLKESGQYTNSEMKGIKTSREDAIFSNFETTLQNTEASAEALEAAMNGLAKTVKNLSTEQLAAVDMTRLSSEAVASQITDKQLDGLKESNKLTPAQLDTIKASRSAGLANIAEHGVVKVGDAITTPTGPGAAEFITKQRETLFKGNAQDVGKMPEEVFIDPNMTEYITPGALQQRMRNNMSKENIKKVESNIRVLISEGTPTSNRARKVWQKWSNSTTEGASFDFTTDID